MAGGRRHHARVRELIRERVRAGMAAAKARRIGRRKVPMAVQGQIRRLRAQGLSVRKVAAEAGVSVGTVMNYGDASGN